MHPRSKDIQNPRAGLAWAVRETPLPAERRKQARLCPGIVSLLITQENISTLHIKFPGPAGALDPEYLRFLALRILRLLGFRIYACRDASHKACLHVFGGYRGSSLRAANVTQGSRYPGSAPGQPHPWCWNLSEGLRGASGGGCRSFREVGATRDNIRWPQKPRDSRRRPEDGLREPPGASRTAP